jgi:hypothetical protein
MDLNAYVGNLGREFATLAEAGGEEARAVVERLTGPLESAIRMTLLEVLSAAADEITRDLAPGSVELRLRGRDPGFVVTAPPPPPPAPAGSPGSPESPGSPWSPAEPGPATIGPDFGEDGPAARINVRMPEQLKAAIEEAAAREGRSVNAWLSRAAAAALHRADRDQRAEPRPSTQQARQAFTGWVR